MTIRELKDKVAMVIVTESITDQVARGHQIINEDDVAESIAELFQSHLRESLERVRLEKKIKGTKNWVVPLLVRPIETSEEAAEYANGMFNDAVGKINKKIDTELKGLGGKE